MGRANALLLTSLAALSLLAAGCSQPAQGPDVDVQVLDEGQRGPLVDGPDPRRGFIPNEWLSGLPTPPSSRVSNGAEPSILTDKDGRFVWIGDTSGLYISEDNGTSWTRGAYPFILSADGWSLAQDSAGDLYFSTTSVPWIDVARSSDGGQTAEWVARFVDVAPVADRPWLAANAPGEVVMMYYDFGKSFSEPCIRTTDGGMTWLDRGYLQASPQGGNVVYDAEGAFYLSDNGGTVYGFDGKCLLGTNSGRILQGDLGANNMIQLAASGTDLYTAASDGQQRIVLAGAHGLGGSSKQMVLSPPELKSNTFATISAWGDELAVAWYGSETAGDPSSASFEGAFNVYVALVRGFWTASPEVRYVRVTEEPNHVGDICMDGIGCEASDDRDLLDYFMLDHDRWGGVHVAYGHDGSGSSAEVRHAHLPPGWSGAVASAEGTGEGPGSPVARLSLEADGLKVRADASTSADPDGGALAYAWDWGDAQASLGEATAIHAYEGAGTYTVTLRVTDPDGRTATAAAAVHVDGVVRNRVPTAAFGHQPQVPGLGEPVVFTDLSTDSDGELSTPLWRFGDGASAEGRVVQRSFDDPGRYLVRLDVEDGWGAASNVTRTVTVTGSGSPVLATAVPELQSEEGQDRAAPAPALAAVAALAALASLMRRRLA